MFDALIRRSEAAAERRARERTIELAARIGAALPAGIRAEARPEGIILSGHDLARRLTLHPVILWGILETLE